MQQIVFTIIAVLITALIYVLPFSLLLNLLTDTAVFQASYAFICLGLSAIILYYLRTHSASRILAGITFYGMGIGFIALPIVVTGQLISIFLPSFQFEIGVFCSAILVLLCLLSIYQGRKINSKTLSFVSKKIKKNKNFIFISDIHIGSNPKAHLEHICHQLKKEVFDFLLIGGDLFDASSFDPRQLEPLRALDCPIYFVTGNHEYYVANHLDKLKRLKKYNITMLDNQAVKLDQLNLIGISDNQKKSKQKEQAKNLITKDRFNLLMVHQPSLWGDLPADVDLMLSGHTHNGQIFPFNLLVRLQFKAVYGLYKDAETRLYVSSGAGTWGPRMRLGTQNEIVKISLSAG